VLDAALPIAIWPTFFSNLGNTIFATMLLWCALSALVARRRRRVA
jgi:uncharacterized protein (TIGR03382 family)